MCSEPSQFFTRLLISAMFDTSASLGKTSNPPGLLIHFFQAFFFQVSMVKDRAAGLEGAINSDGLSAKKNLC